MRWEAPQPDGTIKHESRTFARKDDADDFDRDVKVLKARGELHLLDADATQTTAAMSLTDYVVNVWTPAMRPILAPKTMLGYAAVYDRHLAPAFGKTALRDITTPRLARWQSAQLSSGVGAHAVRKALMMLSAVMSLAVEEGAIGPGNPVHGVRKPKLPKRTTEALSPLQVERMRLAVGQRDAAMIGTLAYSGVRPGELLALTWRDVGERTLHITKAVSVGEVGPTKTRRNRSARLVTPLRSELLAWRMSSGRPDDSALVFPHPHGQWDESKWQSWRRRVFATAVAAIDGAASDPEQRTCPRCGAGNGKPCRTPAGRRSKRMHAERRTPKTAGRRPYDLRHSAASLWLAEGHSVVTVAAWLGHSPGVLLATYAHLIAELEGAGRIDADAEILAARERAVAPELPTIRAGAGHAS